MHTSPETLALLALDESVGSPEEHAHLALCPVCTAELDEMRRVVVVARQSDPEDGLSQPSPAVWQNIRAEIAALEPSGLSSGGSAAVPPRRSAGRRRLALTLAAAFALVIGLGVGFGAGRLSERDEVAAPSVHLNAMPTWPGAEGQAEVTTDAQGDRILVVTVKVPEPATGRMEVWLSDDKSLNMQAMGYLNGDSGTFKLDPGMDLSKSPIIDVSMEPVNDPSPEHSLNSVVRGRLIR